MTERQRIIAWWIYVLCVIAIYIVVFQAFGFLYAVGATLAAIALLGVAVKMLVGRLSQRGRTTHPAKDET